MCIINTRKQRHIAHRQEGRSHVKLGCGSKVVPKESISSNIILVPRLHLVKPYCRPCSYKVAQSINPVPNLKTLSPIMEHLSAANRRPDLVDTTNRTPRRVKQRSKQKEADEWWQQLPLATSRPHTIKCQVEERKNDDLPRLPVGSGGKILLSSLLQPDLAAENLGFQDPLIEVTSTEEADGGKPKVCRTNNSISGAEGACLLVRWLQLCGQCSCVPSCYSC